MRLLLDQGLPQSETALLRDVDIDTIHVSEIGISEAEDVEIIKRAREERRIVAILDADFHALLVFDEATSPSDSIVSKPPPSIGCDLRVYSESERRSPSDLRAF